MAELNTDSPESNYVSRNNIVVPRAAAGGLVNTDVAARAKTNIEARLGYGDTVLQSNAEAPLSGKTLSAVSTPKQETT
jgi:hypothetical protein